jgi:hypothetical protein
MKTQFSQATRKTFESACGIQAGAETQGGDPGAGAPGKKKKSRKFL